MAFVVHVLKYSKNYMEIYQSSYYNKVCVDGGHCVRLIFLPWTIFALVPKLSALFKGVGREDGGDVSEVMHKSRSELRRNPGPHHVLLDETLINHLL